MKVVIHNHQFYFTSALFCFLSEENKLNNEAKCKRCFDLFRWSGGKEDEIVQFVESFEKVSLLKQYNNYLIQ